MKKWYVIYSVLIDTLMKVVEQHGVDKVGSYLLNLFLTGDKYEKQELSWLFKSYRIVQDKQVTGEWITEPQLDPMQLFVSFNNNTSKYENRIKRIRAIFDILNIHFEFDEIDFDGCPTPVVVQAIKLKTDKDAILLWKYFRSVVNTTVDKETFGDTTKVYGVEATLLSIFTFWVNQKYIPLDKWTLSYLTNGIKSLTIEESLSRPEDLFSILNFEYSYSNFTGVDASIIDLVKNAYEWQEHSEGLAKGSFKLLAFKTLQMNSKLFKILQPQTYYILDSNLTVKGDSLEYEFDKFNVFELAAFNKRNDLNININAIVGKNGSGKSTLIELFYLLLYNLSVQQGFIKSDMHEQILYPIEEINFEVYFEYNDVFKLTYSSRDGKPILNLYKSATDSNGKIIFDTAEEDLRIYKSLFYTIAINYSLYSLNSLDYKEISSKKFDWISSLTHKNDGYQTPIVITPMRENGNINVNLERSLTKQRLLINLLRLHNDDSDDEINYSFRSLDNNKTFTHVRITGETAKIVKYRDNLSASLLQRTGSLDGLASQYADEKRVDYKKKILKDYIENLPTLEINELFKSIKSHYDIAIDVEPAYQLYLIVKLYKICWYYNSYHRFYKIFSKVIDSSEINFRNMLIVVDEDNSHITDKFKQLVNYLKSGSLREIYQVNRLLHLDKINATIENLLIQGTRGLDYPKKVINRGFNILYQHLIVPPIFDYVYYYNDTIKAETLSSGEQQMLSSIGNMLYHIRNLESKYGDSKVGLQYRFVNVVLDEIELYFHPEYQRKYIYRLLTYLSSASFGLNNIWGINLLFSTHSPFILSDIPSQKILRMADGLPSLDKDGLNSFGANIHDLLNDEFFMEKGAMGEFAKKYINELITELTSENNNELENDSLGGLIKDKIDIIGEPLLKNSLMALWHEKFASDNLPSYQELVTFYNKNYRNN